jgi:hypothetical protein
MPPRYHAAGQQKAPTVGPAIGLASILIQVKAEGPHQGFAAPRATFRSAAMFKDTPFSVLIDGNAINGT